MYVGGISYLLISQKYLSAYPAQDDPRRIKWMRAVLCRICPEIGVQSVSDHLAVGAETMELRLV